MTLGEGCLTLTFQFLGYYLLSPISGRQNKEGSMGDRQERNSRRTAPLSWRIPRSCSPWSLSVPVAPIGGSFFFYEHKGIQSAGCHAAEPPLSFTAQSHQVISMFPRAHNITSGCTSELWPLTFSLGSVTILSNHTWWLLMKKIKNLVKVWRNRILYILTAIFPPSLSV
jgi:hypothetical protein